MIYEKLYNEIYAALNRKDRSEYRAILNPSPDWVNEGKSIGIEVTSSASI